MSAREPSIEQVLAHEVHLGGANRPFGDLTLEQVRARADELRSVAGWGPTMRVVPVAQAWRELELALQRDGKHIVRELEPEIVRALAQRMWILMPSGPLMR